MKCVVVVFGGGGFECINSDDFTLTQKVSVGSVQVEPFCLP